MPFDSIKIILLAITALVIVYLLLLKKNLQVQKVKFLISSLVVTLILLLIIVIKLHHLLRSELGIPNTLTYFFVLIPFVFHFYNFRLDIIRTNFVLLLLSIGFISCAVLVDLLTDGKIIPLAESDLIEELLRITGTGLWMLYYFLYSLKLRNI
jgi:hypothetical protein